MCGFDAVSYEIDEDASHEFEVDVDVGVGDGFWGRADVDVGGFGELNVLCDDLLYEFVEICGFRFGDWHASEFAEVFDEFSESFRFVVDDFYDVVE